MIMNIMKRTKTEERFNENKIKNAVRKAGIDAGFNGEELENIVNNVTSLVVENLNKKESDELINVEEIQDEVENALMELKYKKIARAYIIYRNQRAEKRNKPWELSDLTRDMLYSKYIQPNETFDEWMTRISGGDLALEKLMRNKKFLFAGRILANRGLYKEGIKTTYSNCYVVTPPTDSLEGIYEAAYKIARTFSYGGGVGVDISKLRPKNSPVHNAAKTTSGAVSFMELFNMTTSIIGQNGRRGALMISMSVDHPDIDEFIDIKRDLNKITKANISLRITNEFMKAVENDEIYECEFSIDEHEHVILKPINARKLFMRLCENNWDMGEPGLLYWDRITDWNLMSGDSEFEYVGVNPCAEEPLPAGGSCLLGSLNLAEFVDHPFTENARLNIEGLLDAVRIAVIGLNDVLDEGLPLHPLEEQRKSVSELRQIGLGTMGLADMLLKLNIRYGSDEAVEFARNLSNQILNKAVETSALIAKEKGAFERYSYNNIAKSEFFQKQISEENKELVRQYGLRNSQLLTQAPTGSISTMLGVSGGMEPIYNISYIRKTESLHDEDVYYRIYTPIVKEFMEMAQITDESLLPETFVTAMTLNPMERIRMQAAWQENTDASISSTINLPNEATIEDVYNIYMEAWKYGLKGVTVFRDGCSRAGILINEKPNEDKKKTIKSNLNVQTEKTTTVCPECGGEYTHTGGCGVCLECGYSKCN